MSDITDAQEELETLFVLNNEGNHHDQYNKNPIIKMMNGWHKRNAKTANKIFSQIPAKTYYGLEYPANIWMFDQILQNPALFPSTKPELVFDITEENFYNIHFDDIEYFILKSIEHNFQRKNKATQAIELLKDDSRFWENTAKNPVKFKIFLDWANTLPPEQCEMVASKVPSVLASKMNILGHTGLLIKLNALLEDDHNKNTINKMANIIKQMNVKDIKKDDLWNDVAEFFENQFNTFKQLYDACQALGWSDKKLALITPKINAIDLRDNQEFLQHFFDSNPTLLYKNLEEYLEIPLDDDGLNSIGGFCKTLTAMGVDIEKIPYTINMHELGWQADEIMCDLNATKDVFSNKHWKKAWAKNSQYLPKKLINAVLVTESVFLKQPIPSVDVMYPMNKKDLLKRSDEEYDDIVYDLQDALAVAVERSNIVKNIKTTPSAAPKSKRKI